MFQLKDKSLDQRQSEFEMLQKEMAIITKELTEAKAELTRSVFSFPFDWRQDSFFILTCLTGCKMSREKDGNWRPVQQ